MDHDVEPPSSLPEGAAVAVTEEATAASGQAEADAASEQVSLNGTHDDTERQLTHDPAPLPSEVGALNGSQEYRPRRTAKGGVGLAGGAEAGAGPDPEGLRTPTRGGPEGRGPDFLQPGRRIRLRAGRPGRQRARPGVYNGLSRCPERVQRRREPE